MNPINRIVILTAGVCFIFWIHAAASFSQQINVSTPLNSTSSSFSENFGTNFGFSLAGGSGNGSRVVGLLPSGQTTPNINFFQNGSNSVNPSFGGFDPNSGATFGFGRRSPNGSGFSLGFSLSQGSTRTSSSVTPNLTLPNGGFGSITSGQLRPFVTGITPVVARDNAVMRGIASGKLKPYDASRVNKQRPARSTSAPVVANSSATSGDMSVAEIRAEKIRVAEEKSRRFQEAIAHAEQAEQNEDFILAKSKIREAIKLTVESDEKRRLKTWLKKLSRKR